MAEAPHKESVDELLKIVQRLVDDERARGQALETKTSSLAGFTGAILAITAALGRELTKTDLGTVGDVVFRSLFMVAIVSLGVASVLAVLGVLRPQRRLAVSRSQLQGFTKFPMLAVTRMEIQGRMLTTLVQALEVERQVNDRKARLTRHAAAALALGLVGVAGQALALVIASF